MMGSPAWMNEEVEAFQASMKKFYLKEFVPRMPTWEANHCVEPEIWQLAAGQGMLCTSIPECYGGMGGTAAHDAVVFMEQGAIGDSSFGNPLHNIVAHYILAFGTEAQKQDWLPKLAAAERIGGIAMTEPAAGSDLQAITTTARRDGDHYVINGSKTYISNGLIGNLFIVVCKTNPDAKAKGVSLLVVETEGLAGFSRGQPLRKIGTQGQDTAELFFDEVRVPQTALLGHLEGQGFYQLMQQLPWERLLIAITAVGLLDYAISLTVEYTRQRRVFGGSLFDLQNTRFKLAEARTKLELLRAFVNQSIQKYMDGQLSAAEASMAKWWSTDALCDVVDDCVQLHGGAGVMLDYPIARLYADVRVQRIYGGSNEIMKELIARSL